MKIKFSFLVQIERVKEDFNRIKARSKNETSAKLDSAKGDSLKDIFALIDNFKRAKVLFRI